MKKITLTLCAILCALCAIIAQNKPTGVLMNLTPTDKAQPNAISENGKWMVTSTFIDGNYYDASLWNLETGDRQNLSEDISDALCVNNAGTIVGGSYLGQPAYWLKSDGIWHSLEMPIGYSSATGDVVSMTIVDNDTIMIGNLYTGMDGGTIARWINGKIDNDFKYRNYTRNKEILGVENEAGTAIVRGMSTNAQNYLISLNYNDLLSTPTTFVQIGADENYKTTVIEREFGQYSINSFVEEAKMSHNGKFVCGRIYGVPSNEKEAGSPSVSFLYNVDEDLFIHYGDIEEIQRYAGASCVDNQGHVYFKSVDGSSPLGKPYIYKNDKYIELEKCLLAYEGITAEQIDAIAEEVEGSDADDLGIVWCVSGDGKTLVGAGDDLKGNIWCAKLSCSPYDVDSYTAVENITYNNLAAYYTNGAISIEGNAEKIEVYSITGAKIMSQAVENNTIKADLRNGIYVVKIYNGNNIATSKIIVK